MVKKITESQLKSIIKETLNNTLNEISISQKKKLNKQAINGVQGNLKSIKTLGIITCENPNADEIEYGSLERSRVNKINRKVRPNFIDNIKKLGYKFVIAKGKYGNVENPAIIFNISKIHLTNLAKEYNQSSFIYIIVNENGTVNYCYFDKQNDYSQPTKIENSIDIINDADDLYTQIGKKIKFSIPFNFNECVNKFYNTILERCNNDQNKMDRLLKESINASAYRSFVCRKILYGENDIFIN